ncbi:MAG: DEAD/DEAH box helicase family protein [Candidatus Phlomobacter fragariae]
MVDAIHQNRGNGYILHTTGSGKTLTSFKVWTLLKDNPDIEKCLLSIAKTLIARHAKNLTNFRRSASRKTPIPKLW